MKPIIITTTLAVMVASAAWASASEARASGTRTFTLTSSQPITGEPDMRAMVRTTIAFPRRWKAVRRTRATVTLREGPSDCQYTVRVKSGVVAGAEAEAAARAKQALPATGPYLLRQVDGPDAAWRIVRVQDPRRTRVEAVRDAPFEPSTAPDGMHLWVETRISAASDVGDVCHSGSYRSTLAGALSRALTGARTVASEQ